MDPQTLTPADIWAAFYSMMCYWVLVLFVCVVAEKRRKDERRRG